MRPSSGCGRALAPQGAPLFLGGTDGSCWPPQGGHGRARNGDGERPGDLLSSMGGGGGGERGRPLLEALVACDASARLNLQVGRKKKRMGGRCAKAARRNGRVDGRADGRPSGDRSSARPGHTILMWSAAAMPLQPPWPLPAQQ